jgi:hypothetical protein
MYTTALGPIFKVLIEPKALCMLGKYPTTNYPAQYLKFPMRHVSLLPACQSTNPVGTDDNSTHGDDIHLGFLFLCHGPPRENSVSQRCVSGNGRRDFKVITASSEYSLLTFIQNEVNNSFYFKIHLQYLISSQLHSIFYSYSAIIHVFW